MQDRRAFTLIELLVVIAIVALLLAILLPTLASARQTAIETQCKSNLRQVFLAQEAYAHDFGKYSPIWSYDSRLGPEPPLQDYVGQQLRNDDAVVQCPAVLPEEIEEQTLRAGWNIQPVSYGINSAMGMKQWRYDPMRVPTPSKIIAIAEQPVEPFETALTADGYGVVSRDNALYSYWYRIISHNPYRGYRHGGADGANVVMMDGHVERLAHARLGRDDGHWHWWNPSGLVEVAQSGGGCGCQ